MPGGQDAFFHVMRQSDSTTIDIQRIRSKKDLMNDEKKSSNKKSNKSKVTSPVRDA